jgi:uncharacterized protein with gpF-like domain
MNAIFLKLVKKYGEDVIKEVGDRLTFQANAQVQNYVSTSTGTLIQNVNETTKRRIREQIGKAFDNQETVGDIRARISGVFEEATQVRAKTIAVTEATRITGFASDEAINQSGADYKEWLATMDGQTRDAHAAMDGQIVPAEGQFTAPGGYHTSHPGGFHIARLDINCRCAITAAFAEKSIKGLTEVQRRALWQERERKRKLAQNEILDSFVKIFTMQQEAVFKKIDAMLGGI